MKKILILFIILLVSCNNKSTYRGYIYIDTKEPLRNAKVTEEGTDNSVYTNNNGYFSLSRSIKTSVRDLVVQYENSSNKKSIKYDTIRIMYSGGIQEFKYLFLEKKIDTISIN